MNFSETTARLPKNRFAKPVTLALMVVLGLVLAGVFNRSGFAGQKQQDLEYGVTYTCPQGNNYEFKVLSCDYVVTIKTGVRFLLLINIHPMAAM
jgi:hypothetical protein